MKKVLSILTVALMTLCFFWCTDSVNASAEEKMNIIYATVPADWENPCVWAWDADGVGAFSAWPGGEMIADEANEGWFYIYVPASMTNVIINANEGSVQTSDMSTEGLDAWVTVNSAEDATITNDKQTEGDLPAYVATFTVYVKVDETWLEPCLWAWSAPDGTNVFPNWPGEALASNPDGFYSYQVPEWVNSIIVNANVGTVQTADISVEAKDLWVLVDAEGEFDLFYEKPEASADELVTVHAKVPSDWLMPCLWAWSAPDGTNAFANWPGEELNLTGDWYTYSVPNWINSIIINGNLGTVQTTDVSVETGKDVWLVVKSADECQLFYAEPTEADLNAEASAASNGTEEATETKESDVITTKAIEPEVEAKKSNAPIVVCIAAGVAVLGGALGVVTAKKKKKSA